jgi:hypothetical protein
MRSIAPGPTGEGKYGAALRQPLKRNAIQFRGWPSVTELSERRPKARVPTGRANATAVSAEARARR